MFIASKSSLRRLAGTVSIIMTKKTYHIIFKNNYYKKSVGFRSNEHKSWNLKTLANVSGEFGGKTKEGLNRLFKLSENFDGDIRGVEFAIDFVQFFNAQIQDKHLFYQHSNERILAYTKDILNDIPYSNYALQETQIEIAETPVDLLNQEWEGNCNRVGGNPIWVQEEVILICPNCRCEMDFIFQLDSGLPDYNDQNSNEIMFGNDGILYAFWCKEDLISGFLWQCT